MIHTIRYIPFSPFVKQIRQYPPVFSVIGAYLHTHFTNTNTMKKKRQDSVITYIDKNSKLPPNWENKVTVQNYWLCLNLHDKSHATNRIGLQQSLNITYSSVDNLPTWEVTFFHNKKCLPPELSRSVEHNNIFVLLFKTFDMSKA